MDQCSKPLELSELRFSGVTETALRKDPFVGQKIAGIAKGMHELRMASRIKQAELLDYYTDKLASYQEGTHAWLAASRTALEDPRSPAGVLLIAARNIFGPSMTAWEPDSVRIEIDNEKLNVPAVNYDKLFAAVTLLEVPAFYFEVATFTNTILAFNHEGVDVEIIQEPAPEHIAWGVYEAEIVRHENQLWEPSFDLEPIEFTAVVLHRAGFVLAPTILAFAQESLDRLNTGNHVDLAEVRAAWEKLPKGDALATRTFDENPLDIQLAKLASVEHYVSVLADEYTKAMGALSRGA